MAEEKKKEEKELDVKIGSRATGTEEVFYAENENNEQIILTPNQMMYEIYKQLKKLNQKL